MINDLASRQAAAAISTARAKRQPTSIKGTRRQNQKVMYGNWRTHDSKIQTPHPTINIRDNPNRLRSKSARRNSSHSVGGSLTSNKRIHEDIVITGPNYYYAEPGPNTKKLLGPEATATIEKTIRDFLEKAGFKRVNTPGKAHVLIMSRAEILITNSKDSKPGEKDLENSYGLAAFVSSHNHRDKEWFKVWFQTKKEWPSVLPEFVEQTEYPAQ